MSATAFGDKETVGSSPQQPLAVSLVRLIATPQAFDGKYVQVTGFVGIEHEGTAIYLHRDDWQHMLTKNGVWLVVSDIPAEDSGQKNKGAVRSDRGTFRRQQSRAQGLVERRD
jgi:hypothetical protein